MQHQMRNLDYGFGEEGGNAAVVGGTQTDTQEDENDELNDNHGS